ncbi:M23 family metallopeptidase [Roseivirga sp. BDSF3-8]|uniref:M23 family metallopeptidase n=1 Tax=Roseivirga sp. BDSF3-8 TaxID=3241598 RepID=UPI003531B704
MKLNKPSLLLIFCFFCSLNLLAQDGEYLFPIKPGQRNYLAGTMGELRSSHYHGGIDIKTEQREGLDVLATQDGYVSRIKVSGYGYGNALYIKHPDGNTSVYGHLQRFNKEIADYVRQEQYNRESFGVDLFPEKSRFPVKKGEVVAISGNTGGSSGPHLHFEIRDGSQRPLNPLKFGFKNEVKDNTPPTVYGVAIRPLDSNSRIEGRYNRQEVSLSKNGSTYSANPVSAYGTLGVEVYTIDQLDGASNRNGVPHIYLNVDSTEVFAKHLNRFAFADSRQILVHMDYPTKAATNKKYQKLYIGDGNDLDFFDKGKNNGRIVLKDSGRHQIEIVLKDEYGNTSRVAIPVNVSEPDITSRVASSPYQGASGYELTENTLLSYALLTGDTPTKAKYFANQASYEVDPAYQVNDHIVYLWDMRYGLPDSVNLCSTQQKFDFDMMIPSGKEFHFYNKYADLHFSRNTLFDTLYLRLNYQENFASGLELWQINESDPIPFQSYMSAVLKPGKEYNKERTHVYGVDDSGNFWWEGGKWEGDNIRFRFRNTGQFTLVTDSVAPEINPIKVNSQSASFNIKDRLSGIGDFRATLNGRFLLMNYDPKNRYIWAEPRTPGQPITGDLELTVTDQAGNVQVYKTKL